MNYRTAIFLDRDGVLVENRDDYVKNIDELKLFPWTLPSLRLLNPLDAYIFIITNQSAVGRGIVTYGAAAHINDELCKVVNHVGGRIDDWFMCPHLPESKCECRKPKAGLIWQALEKYPDVDMDNLIIVGDHPSDIIEVAGSKPRHYLVQSGRWSGPPPYPDGAIVLPMLYNVVRDIEKKWPAVMHSSTSAANVTTS